MTHNYCNVRLTFSLSIIATLSALQAELRERHQLVQMRKQMIERADRRQKEREKIIAQNASKLNAAGEAQMREKVMGMEDEAKKNAEAKNKIDIFENAFRKIKEATGVSDVNEVIQKIVSQEGTTENLLALTKENAQRVDKLNRAAAKTKANLDSLKFTGATGGHRRKLVDDQEDQLVTSTARLNRGANKFDRLNLALTSTKAGIQHIAAKMMSVKEDFPMLTTIAGMEDTDGNLIETLNNVAVAGENMMNRVKAHQIEAGVLKGASGDTDVVSLSLPSLAGSDISDEATFDEEKTLSKLRPYNQRIVLPVGEDWEEHIGVEGFEQDGADGDEEDLTRHKVKEASHHIVSSNSKAKKRRGKKQY